MRAANMEPLEPYPGDVKPWRCHCRGCDRKIRPRFAGVQSGRGCRYCTNHGFDSAGRVVVYLLVHSEGSAARIGVTTASARRDRVARYAEDCWQFVQSWDVSGGDVAVEIERSVLGWWRDTLEALTGEDMPNGVWTEAAALTLDDITETRDRIQAEVDRLAAL